jgi:L-fuculose-phosphate aldolase
VDDFRKLIADSGRRLLASGLTSGVSGNISVRDIAAGNIYVTPSSMDYAVIEPADVPVLNIRGEIIEPAKRPTIEAAMHCEIYAARQDINAIIHTHAVNSTVFACIGENIPLITEESILALKSEVLCADYAPAGTKELADAALRVLTDENSRACLLRSHGAVCLGVDMDEAFRVCEALEKVADIYARVRTLDHKKRNIV